VIADIESMDSVAKVAGKILQATQRNYTVNDQILKISASIGNSQSPENSKYAGMLVKQADIAMYKAKKEGKNRCKVYDPSME